MGVSGLWDILRPTGTVRSFTHVAVVDGFEANRDNVRGLRIGIDASIWFFHAAYGREGENPELRTLFFRCSRLMSMPFLPLFVFDGPKRPDVKRGKRISGNQHWLTNGMKEIIEAFGFEWRMAPGEAEAELAYLNGIGVIDAILSDDVDNFLFGAKTVIRNPSATLTGNRAHAHKNADGRDDGNHSTIYTSAAIKSHPSVQLTRGGLILIGLLSGGDYNAAGVTGCGPGIAHGLAKCGFGDELLDATRSLDRDALPGFLVRWRQSLRDELRTNAHGHLTTKKPSLSKSIPEDFPDLDILLSYTNPITSGTDAGAKRTHVPPKWDREPDVGKIARVCELHFEWGIKDIIIKRFRSVLWPSIVQRILRRATLEEDARSLRPIQPMTPSKRHNLAHPEVIGTPSKMLARHFSSIQMDDDESDGDQLIVKIHSSRTHASTDGLLEYRIEIAPAQLVRLTESGIQGLRKAADTTYDVEKSDLDEEEDSDDPTGGKKAKKPPPDPNSHLRIWMPATMVRIVRPDLVQDYEGVVEKRRVKQSGKGKAPPPRATGRKKAAVSRCQSDDQETFELDGILSSDSEKDCLPVPSKSQMKRQPRSSPSSKASTSTRPRLDPAKKAKSAPAPIPPAPSENVRSPARPPRAATQPFRSSVLSKLDDIVPPLHTPRMSPSPTKSAPLRPFPMAFEEEESSEDEDYFALPVPNSRTYPRKSKPGQRRSRTSSNSDNGTNNVKKSPRKASEHTSPRRQDTRPRRNTSRPASPLPSKHRTPTETQAVALPRMKHVKTADESYIDISTGSEGESVAGSTFPLLLARVRGNKTLIPPGQSRRTPIPPEVDFIDLT
ncbi:hypothetical protein FA95DRAFT_1604179 [Auriscalpium vulgare]|uniref:Uncharacterized protein n=1 Tax=Auriscalpium vulgare TaxID=40419 RepID=A0ACB8RZR2_9AGAM|nr:hypothetical protein FA95DRAFT_1604179 [Auriscalpium vulgare]